MVVPLRPLRETGHENNSTGGMKILEQEKRDEW